MIKTVIFDFFGVISSEVAPFWFGERYDEAEAKRLKEKYMSAADIGKVSAEELFESLSRLSGEPPKKIHDDFLALARIDYEMVSLIKGLSNEYNIVLLSNAQSELLDEIMSRDGLYDLFDHTVISGKEGIAKPDGKIFDLALLRSGSAACESVFIDDNPKNVSAAEMRGIRGILFDGIDGLRHKLDKIGVKCK